MRSPSRYRIPRKRKDRIKRAYLACVTAIAANLARERGAPLTPAQLARARRHSFKRKVMLLTVHRRDGASVTLHLRGDEG